MSASKPTRAELMAKIYVYENFLHLLQLNAEVALNPKNVHTLIGNACRWSYAHRQGNGELSSRAQTALVDEAFAKLTKLD